MAAPERESGKQPMISEPNTDIEAEREAVRETTRRFIAREITPHYRGWERAGAIPRELWSSMGAAGLLCWGWRRRGRQ